MKFSLTEDALKRVADLCCEVAPRAPNEVMRNVRLHANGSMLIAEACAEDTSIRVEVPAIVQRPGDVLVPAGDLKGIAAAVQDTCSLTLVSMSSLSWSSGSRRGTCGVRDTGGWPGVLDGEYPHSAQVVGEALACRINAISWSMGEYSKPSMYGIHISSDGDGLRLRATSGHTLASARLKYPGAQAIEGTLLAAPCVRRMVATLGKFGGHCLLMLGDGVALQFSRDTVRCTIHARPTAATFPLLTFTKLTGGVFQAVCSTSRTNLASEVRAASLLVKRGKNDSGDIRLNCESGALKIERRNDQSQEFIATMAARVDEQGIEVLADSMNGKEIVVSTGYLQRSVAGVIGEGVRLSVSTGEGLTAQHRGNLLRLEGLDEDGATPFVSFLITQMRA